MVYGRLMTTRQLGRTDIYVSPIGLGTAQFAGKGWISALTPPVPQENIDTIIETALDRGITWFDTSEMYGGGTSERALAHGLTHAGIKPGDVTVATKWLPLGRTARNIESTVGKRLEALDPFPIDLHQIHLNRGSFSSVRAQMRAMARLVQAGKIRAVGVSNFTRQMEPRTTNSPSTEYRWPATKFKSTCCTARSRATECSTPPVGWVCHFSPIRRSAKAF
jgi:aryl-alcohol dehydrogenase-like predicted oxidoreductase